MIKNVIVNPSYLEIPTTPSPSQTRASTKKRVPVPRASSRRKNAAGSAGAVAVAAAGSEDDISRRLEELRKRSYERGTFESAVEMMSGLEKEEGKRKRGGGGGAGGGASPPPSVSMVLPDSLRDVSRHSGSVIRIKSPGGGGGGGAGRLVEQPPPPPPSWSPAAGGGGGGGDEAPLHEVDLPLPKELFEAPKYGCLKYGSLWRGKTTQKNTPPAATTTNTTTTTTSVLLEKKLADDLARQKGMLTDAVRNRKKYCKKTSRRVHKIGKRESLIGVLISNKKMRNDMTEKLHGLKRKNMGDVRKFLYQHGFIKIGSCSPDDLLRDIYENCSMLCGVVENHNPDNVLYNYLYGRTSAL